MLQARMSKDRIQAETADTVDGADVTFRDADSGVFVITGLTGSRRLTTTCHVQGTVEPAGRKVGVEGNNVNGLSSPALKEVRQEKMAMVFRHFALLPLRTIQDNGSHKPRARDKGRLPAGHRSEWTQSTAGQVTRSAGLLNRSSQTRRQLAGPSKLRYSRLPTTTITSTAPPIPRFAARCIDTPEGA